MPNYLYDFLLSSHLNDSRLFLQQPDGKSITYRGFLELASSQAHVLARSGMTPGDRLIVQADKSFEALGLYAACIMTGIVLIPLNTAYTLTELAYYLDDGDVRGIVCCSETASSLEEAIRKPDLAIFTLNADGSGSLMDEARRQRRQFTVVDRMPNDLAAILYTSGTTGRSKGAMLTHANLLSNAQALKQLWQFTSDDVLLHALPLSHIHGLFIACNVMLLAGGTILFLPKFDLDQVFEMLPEATSMMGVPTFYDRLLNDARLTRDAAARIRVFISGSAPLRSETFDAFEQRTGHCILERYGMTETNITASNPYNGERRAGTVGLPVPGVELIITDPETGEPLAKGETGMIEVRGPGIFAGYWRMPEKTDAELRQNGFFITGDIGKLDANGYVHIVGRAKDLIISGGLNVYPEEIELLLDAQPGILESAVVGVSHLDFGEAVLGIVVPVPGVSPDLELISKTISASLANFKRPKKLVLMEELPRNAMGKVQKALLREKFKSVFSE